VIVSATTDCFSFLGFEEAVEKISDLEYVHVEICLDENGNQIKPSEIADNVGAAVIRCGGTRRMSVSGFLMRSHLTGEEYFEQFDAICNLAKLSKVVTITVESSELGTPFNEEVERLKRLVDIAETHGVRVGMRSQFGSLSEDPDTVSVICDHVKGLGLGFDPSQYIYQATTNRNIDKILKYTSNVYLRDTTKDQLQVRVGQGDIDYGKYIGLLGKLGYRRSLCVDIKPDEDTDHFAEMRKLRLLLESLLV